MFSFVEELRERRLMAIVRGTDPVAALRTIEILASSGVRLIEISLTSTDAFGVLARARQALGPSAMLGAGTVLSGADAARAADAGASFLVTPALVPELGAGLPAAGEAKAQAAGLPVTPDPPAQAAGLPVTPDPPAQAAGLPVVMGAFTPSEVAAAMRYGAAAVKIFPASAGGPAYLRALRDPFPSVPFVAVGGVSITAAGEYLAAGARAVGAGSPLIGDAASGGDLGSLSARIEQWRAAGLVR